MMVGNLSWFGDVLLRTCNSPSSCPHYKDFRHQLHYFLHASIPIRLRLYAIWEFDDAIPPSLCNYG